MKRGLPLLLLCGCLAASGGCDNRPAAEAKRVTPGQGAPNVVLIVCDDLGFGDLGPYGARGYRTPHVDRLAAEGARLTDFSVPQAVCSASRAALLTGRYPNRLGILGALGPGSSEGLRPEEVTMAEALRDRGYATALYGKWHLGHLPQHLPTRHGFDEWYGLPYSNDMWPRHPETPRAYPPLPLMEGDRVLETNPDQSTLTGEYARRSVRFMEANREKPFFLYLAHSMPHVPLFASKGFQGRTSRGLYGDVLEEIDSTVGSVLDALDRLKLTNKTMVIVMSDNGPWLSYGTHAGSAGPLREGKGTTFEGGVRVPCLVRWPGHAQAGVVIGRPAMSLDLFPTILKAAGADLPARRVDGYDLGALLAGGDSPRQESWYYLGRELQAVRMGRWKLHLAHDYRSLDGRTEGRDGIPAKYARKRLELSLFDLESDPGESKNHAARRPDDVKRLMEAVKRARAELGDSAAQTGN